MEQKWHSLTRIVVASVVLVALILILPTCASSGKTEESKPAQQPIAKPAEFQVGAVTFTPKTVMANDSVTVTTNVANIGGTTGVYTAVVTVDGKEVEKKDVVVGHGGSQTLSFKMLTAAPGEYKVAIGSSNISMKVWNWSPYTIKYDDELANPIGIYYKGEFGHIIRFTPPTTPFRIQKIMVNGGRECGYEKDCDAKNFLARVWNKDRKQQLWTQEFPWTLFGTGDAWRELNVPNVRADDDFYVEIVTHSEAPRFEGLSERPLDLYIYFGNCKEAARSGGSLNGQPLSGSVYGEPKCWHIRVVGEGAP